MIGKKEMEFWIENNLNVLFKGRHGVGKTSLIIEAFENAGLKWKYFSASTMDPWVDFIGIPKERIESDGSSHLELVRPKEFSNDDVEALFFDEYNRAPKKVRNAVMELIQFKSINGKKFKNLKIVWAAVNPDDDEDEVYDVEVLDPAQLDRFQVHVDIPYKPEYSYFSNKYGAATAKKAIEWWKSQSETTQKSVSPRRLDYLVDVYNKGGKIDYVLPSSANKKYFQELMNSVQLEQEYEKLKGSTEEEKKALLREESFYARIHPYLEQEGHVEKFLRFYPQEKIGVMASSDNNILTLLLEQELTVDLYKEILNGIVNASLDKEKSTFIKVAREKGIKEAKNELMKGSFLNFSLDKNWFKNEKLCKTWDEASLLSNLEKRKKQELSLSIDWVNHYVSSYMHSTTSDGISIKRSENTNGRRSCIENASQYFYPNLTVNSLKGTLNMISNYLATSQASTIREDMKSWSYKNTPYIFNYCIEVIQMSEPDYFSAINDNNLHFNHSLMPFKVLLERLDKKQDVYQILNDCGFGLVKK